MNEVVMKFLCLLFTCAGLIAGGKIAEGFVPKNYADARPIDIIKLDIGALAGVIIGFVLWVAAGELWYRFHYRKKR